MSFIYKKSNTQDHISLNRYLLLGLLTTYRDESNMKTVIYKNQGFKKNQFPFFLWVEKITIYHPRA